MIALTGLVASLFIPLAYCKYGCATGLIFKFLRKTAATNRFGKRDVMAGGLLLIAVVLLFKA